MPPIRLYLRIGLVSFLAKREQSEGRRPELFGAASKCIHLPTKNGQMPLFIQQKTIKILNQNNNLNEIT